MKLLKSVFIMSLVNFLSGCGSKELYQYYDYSRAVYNVDGMDFIVTLNPNQLQPNIYGEIYDLEIVLGFMNDIQPNYQCLLNIHNIKLFNAETNESLTLSDKQSTLKTQSGTYFYFEYEDLNLSYTNKKLEFDYTFENCDIESGKISLLLETDYKEEEIGLWERLVYVT